LKWDGRVIAGVSKVSALKRTTEVVEHREGSDPSSARKSPGRTKYEAITLERGVTHDVEFEQWANKVFNLGGGPGQERGDAHQQLDPRAEVQDADSAKVARSLAARAMRGPGRRRRIDRRR